MLKYRLTAEIDAQLKGIAIELPIHPEVDIYFKAVLVMTRSQHHNILRDLYRNKGIMRVHKYINDVMATRKHQSKNQDHGIWNYD